MDIVMTIMINLQAKISDMDVQMSHMSSCITSLEKQMALPDEISYSTNSNDNGFHAEAPPPSPDAEAEAREERGDREAEQPQGVQPHPCQGGHRPIGSGAIMELSADNGALGH
ncbi:hypothetical protein GUJ93_ZPchr0001g30303 [Zizania palustris]|uniref:Uncharacterized protein n=1 Tax=Zizania palustris TaxID=103762 RepID=A0A8J5R6F4_ZIZPA|nr:hypothetical protein GUJ93_ZPchr0001g30303 [Zizania palustris]